MTDSIGRCPSIVSWNTTKGSPRKLEQDISHFSSSTGSGNSIESDFTNKLK